MKSRFTDFLQLSKIKIMLPVSLTGFTGYFLYEPQLSGRIIIFTLGIFFLAVAASVLNQIQEIDIDSRMERTRTRPLPSGRISPRNAIVYFFLSFFTGSLLIYITGNLPSLLVAFLTIFWYNAIYTYAKRITAFAVFPGALTGALPPVIGWLAAGGSLPSKPIIFLGFLLFTGQIPHFWILVLRYGKEYEKAGLPSLSGLLSKTSISRLTFTWVIVTVFAALFLSFFGIIQNMILNLILLFSSVLLIWQFSRILRTAKETNGYGKYLAFLNSYYLIILVLLISERVINI